MNEITIKLLAKEDSAQLFEFEQANKVYFESIYLSRPDSYYNEDDFNEILEEILYEQNEGLYYMYLIMDQKNNVVGRVNLTSVSRGPVNKAELGYRIGEKHQGKGYATAAVKLILEKAHDVHKLHRIEAGTSPENIGSQIVLIKNGFQFVGKYNQYMLQGTKWVDSIIFEKILSETLL